MTRLAAWLRRLPQAFAPYAKAIMPPLGGLMDMAVKYAETGAVGRLDWAALLQMLQTGVLVWLVPNAQEVPVIPRRVPAGKRTGTLGP